MDERFSVKPSATFTRLGVVRPGAWLFFFMLAVEPNETPFTNSDDFDRTASDRIVDVVWPANRQR